MSARRKVSSIFFWHFDSKFCSPVLHRQTAEIIALLYEATQGPPLPVDSPPALNPTGGVKGKQPPPLNGLQYKKDPSRQGSGVFIARGATRTEDYKDIPEGIIIPSTDAGSGGKIVNDKISLVQQLMVVFFLFLSISVHFNVVPGFKLHRQIIKLN